MNVFDLLGWRSDRPYSISSKTNAGQYAIIKSGGGTSYALSGSNGSYSITGQNATFSFGRGLSGANGTYSITGQNAAFQTGKGLSGSAGSYDIVGNDATFTYSPVVLTTVETLIKLRSFTEHRRF